VQRAKRRKGDFSAEGTDCAEKKSRNGNRRECERNMYGGSRDSLYCQYNNNK
jgi:hypothetical protein